jgi:hypothetical protein
MRSECGGSTLVPSRVRHIQPKSLHRPRARLTEDALNPGCDPEGATAGSVGGTKRPAVAQPNRVRPSQDDKGSSADWTAVADDLARDRRIILPDRLGHARTVAFPEPEPQGPEAPRPRGLEAPRRA